MTETKWLTIADASLLAAEMGLDRTHKTIRSWCRKADLIAEKQTTRTGDRWVTDRDSLITKINFELELKEQQTRTQYEPVQTGSNRFKPVRTSADQSGHVQTSADSSDGQDNSFRAGANLGDPQEDPSEQARIKELESKVMALSIDVGWRDKLLEKYQRENEKGQETLHAQARYIGHLENDLLGLGGKPNEKFLAAPTPKAFEPAEIVHPDQSSFNQNHSGELGILQAQYVIKFKYAKARGLHQRSKYITGWRRYNHSTWVYYGAQSRLS